MGFFVLGGIRVVSFAFLMSFACASSASGAPWPKAARQQIVYTALGDSIAWGLFASKRCWPIVPSLHGCAGATSFVADVAAGLAKNGRQVWVQNLAISGARLETVLSDEVSKISPKATLVTVFIGMNDFSDIAKGAKTLTQFQIQYETLLTYLATNLPRAKIVLLNIPNVDYLPCCTGLNGRANGTWEAGNTFINSLAGKYTIVDLVCDESLYSPAMFPAADGIHPSDAGHAEIAADALAALAAPRRPAASCPPYF